MRQAEVAPSIRRRASVVMVSGIELGRTIASDARDL